MLNTNANASSTIALGDRVVVPNGSILSRVLPGSLGTVVEVEEHTLGVEFDAGSFDIGHGRHHSVRQIIRRDELMPVLPVVPKVPTAPMTKAVLEMLQNKSGVSPLEAEGVLKCRDLPKRISELKKLGWNIERVLKKDPRDGQRYARYSLQKAA